MPNTIKSILKGVDHGIARIIAPVLGYVDERKPVSLRRLCALSLAPPSVFCIPFRLYLLSRPLLFGLWFHWRRTKFRIQHRFANKFAVNQDSQALASAFAHNWQQVGGISRTRTERLMNLVRSIGGFNAAEARTLVMGPRNEAELLSLAIFGFRLENLVAIDLFSYSPLIRVMDMHDMSFADDCFDLTYCAFTIRYSRDGQKACDEITRVTRDGGLVMISFEKLANRDDAEAEFVGTPLRGGIDELLTMFAPNVGDVLWREEWYREPNGRKPIHMCSTIFRVAKNRSQ
jgi:hypothetical protein